MDSLYVEEINPDEIPQPEQLAKWPLNGIDLREVYYNTYDCLFVTDGEGKILTFNPASERLLGFKLDQAGMTVQWCLEQGLYEQSTTLEAIRRRKRVTGLVRSKIGFTLLATSTPLFDENGAIRMVITNSYERSYMDKALNSIVQAERRQRDKYRNAASYLGEMSLKGTRPIAQSPAMRDILDTAKTVAASGSTVLLTGESGTGKDVVATFIHHNSARAHEPFIPVNCAAIPGELMESEFFGYDKGAFTGAQQKGKAGLFEIADGGTLLLDEVGDLPLLMQSKMLRVLENGEVQRVGSVKRHKVDVRIIAATNRDIQHMVDTKLFREDLFYRLNVIPLKLPPLRERREDILPLAHVFLEDFCRKSVCNKYFSPPVEKLLLEYKWPGNIRELRNIVERMAVLSRGAMIDQDICRAVISPADDPLAGRGKSGSTGALTLEPLREFRQRTEEDYLRKAFRLCKGNVVEMAEKLKIHKTGLYKKLQELGIYSGRKVE